jgi:aminopeptidase C
MDNSRLVKDIRKNLVINDSIRNVIHNKGIRSCEKNLVRHNNYDHHFSYTLDNDDKPVDQNDASVCWMCASFNMIRHKFIKVNEINSSKNFSFSYTYLMFWNNFDKALQAMNDIIKLRKRKITNNQLRNIVYHTMNGGGHFNRFKYLVRTYGMVPDTIMQTTHCTKSPDRMNVLLKNIIKEFASRVLNINNCKNGKISKSDCEKIKAEYIEKITRVLVYCIGDPIHPDTVFDWTYLDNNKRKIVVRNLTPISFYEKCKHNCEFDYDDYVIVTHDPRPRFESYKRYGDLRIKKNYGERYKYDESDFDEITIQLPMNTINELILKQLNDGVCTYFASCMGIFTRDSINRLSLDIETYGLPFGLSNVLSMSKADRYDFRMASVNHTMCIVGYDIDDNVIERDHDYLPETISNKKRKLNNGESFESAETMSASSDDDTNDTDDTEDDTDNDTTESEEDNNKTEDITKVNRYKIENSWGNMGEYDGYYMMTKEWMDEFAVSFAIHKKYLENIVDLNSDIIPVDSNVIII